MTAAILSNFGYTKIFVKHFPYLLEINNCFLFIYNNNDYYFKNILYCISKLAQIKYKNLLI